MILLAAAVLVLQVLALASRQFPSQLTSDDLYPYVFCHDLVRGGGPMAGWTLSSAPYWVPDFLAFALLLAVSGWHGGAFVAYAVGSALALGLLAGWFLRELDPAAPGPWRRGFWAANGAVALGWLPGAGRLIWWQLAPGFHGGVLLLALAAAALAAGDAGRPSRARRLMLALVLGLGLISDSLMLLEGLLPLAAALVWAAPDRPTAAARLRRFGAAAGAGALLALAVHCGLAWSRLFGEAPVFRSAPNLGLTRETARLLARDLQGGRLPSVLVAAAVLAALAALAPRAAPVRFAVAWAVSAATFLVGAILVLGYWHDANNARYLHALHVFPLVAAAAAAPALVRRWTASARSRLRAAAALGLAALGAWSAAGLRPQHWVFPYPADVAALDGFCRQRGLDRGLCDFWTLHRVNVLGRAGIRLGPLRGVAGAAGPAGAASFWNSNAYGFLDWDAAARRWKRPRYTFIVTNGLDEAALRARYGEPRESDRVGDWRIWILADPAAATARVLEDVRARLGWQQADGLATALR